MISSWQKHIPRICWHYKGFNIIYRETICFRLIFDPMMWSIKQEHNYYDGPNCWYQFGPFGLILSLNSCKKCTHCV